MKCSGCNGEGKYISLYKIEDPCRFCQGSGVEPVAHGASSDKPSHQQILDYYMSNDAYTRAVGNVANILDHLTNGIDLRVIVKDNTYAQGWEATLHVPVNDDPPPLTRRVLARALMDLASGHWLSDNRIPKALLRMPQFCITDHSIKRLGGPNGYWVLSGLDLKEI